MELFIILSIVFGVIWGCATNAVINSKGYDENWFWWGFFFGFIALIVAVARPEKPPMVYPEYSYNNGRLSNAAQVYADERTLKDGGWKCICGRVNPSYTGTCACGQTKEAVRLQKEAQKEEKADKEAQKSNMSNLDEIKKLKELLDIGAITQEEFDYKKKQLLGI